MRRSSNMPSKITLRAVSMVICILPCSTLSVASSMELFKEIKSTKLGCSKIFRPTFRSLSCRFIDISGLPPSKKKPIVRAMCTDDIVRLSGPDVRAIGEPSCLQPIQIHHLVAPFIPPEKHSNHDYIRNLRKIVLDGCKGIFNQRLGYKLRLIFLGATRERCLRTINRSFDFEE